MLVCCASVQRLLFTSLGFKEFVFFPSKSFTHSDFALLLALLLTASFISCLRVFMPLSLSCQCYQLCYAILASLLFRIYYYIEIIDLICRVIHRGLFFSLLLSLLLTASANSYQLTVPFSVSGIGSNGVVIDAALVP